MSCGLSAQEGRGKPTETSESPIGRSVHRRSFPRSGVLAGAQRLWAPDSRVEGYPLVAKMLRICPMPERGETGGFWRIRSR
jgi:hypothetical protein